MVTNTMVTNQIVRMEQIALALSDPTRLQILDLLNAGRERACCSPDDPEIPEGVCACDILPRLDIAPSRLSYHMKELRLAGLIAEQRRGRWIYYSLNRQALSHFMEQIQQRYLERGNRIPLIQIPSLIQLQE